MLYIPSYSQEIIVRGLQGGKIMLNLQNLGRFTHILRITVFVFLLLNFALTIYAQVATGGQFTLDQSVIASGGGTSSSGAFTVEGTAGQPVAGQKASNSPFSVHAGFWNGEPLGPSAASVTVRGRVQTADG